MEERHLYQISDGLEQNMILLDLGQGRGKQSGGNAAKMQQKSRAMRTQIQINTHKTIQTKKTPKPQPNQWRRKLTTTKNEP